MSPQDLFASPNALARRYSRFRVSERLLLTGHLHQAWPDSSLEARRRAWPSDAQLRESMDRFDGVLREVARNV